jgi:hypothetical protein
MSWLSFPCRYSQIPRATKARNPIIDAMPMPTPAATEIDLEIAGEGIARWFEDVKDPRDRSPEEEPVLRLADASEVGVGLDEELVHWANEVLGGDSAGEVGVF